MLTVTSLTFEAATDILQEMQVESSQDHGSSITYVGRRRNVERPWLGIDSVLCVNAAGGSFLVAKG